MITNKTIITLSMVLGVMALGSAYADDDDDAQIQATSQSASLLTPQEASAEALAAKPGRIVETDLDRRAWPLKGWDYEFAIVDTQGHKWEVEIDAKTGVHGRIVWDFSNCAL